MFTDQVKSTIDKFGLIDKGDKIIVSVSGGPDSTALLFALNGLKLDYGLKLYIAHMDHMFRSSEETKKDYEYVYALSQKLKLPLIFKKIDVPAYAGGSGLSLEEAARGKRYEFLIKVAAEHDARKIAMGHTLDDQAETVLMRMIRGSGLGGLRGIPPKRAINGAFIIRPLIECWRRDVEAYLSGLKISARQDSTNLMQKFLRNRIRHELMLLLERYNPNIKHALARSAWNFSYDYEIVAEAVDRSFSRCGKIKGGSASLNVKRLKALKPGIRRGVIRKAIEAVKGDLRGIDYSHIEDIEGLMLSGKGALDLPAKIRVSRSADILAFSRIKEKTAVPRVWRQFPYPGSVDIPELNLTFDAKQVKSSVEFGKPCSVEYIDLDRIEGSLYIKTWERGDRFKPLGMEKEKKLQDFFVDQKVPRQKRTSVPLLVSGKDIIWVCGMRLSDKVKILPGTKRILKVSFKKT